MRPFLPIPFGSCYEKIPARSSIEGRYWIGTKGRKLCFVRLGIKRWKRVVPPPLIQEFVLHRDKRGLCCCDQLIAVDATQGRQYAVISANDRASATLGERKLVIGDSIH